jgi:transposase
MGKVIRIIHERCCGLDVHKRNIVACVITPEIREIRSFGTMTEDLETMIEWLKSYGCTHVALESTGVYWKPVYNLLESTDLEIFVFNPQHLKALVGRKSDVKDAERIAECLQHGLIAPSNIPNKSRRELQELVRYRRTLIEERSREKNRLQKVLEGANIKLASIATDITGLSAWSMLKELLQGETDTHKVADMAKGVLRKKIPEIRKALKGYIGEHQRLMLDLHLSRIEQLDEHIIHLDEEIKQRIHPFEKALELIDTIPGVNRRNAEEILTETGDDMSRFPTAHHLAAWAGVAPGKNESAGKEKSARSRQGNKHLKRALAQCARAAGRTKGTYLYARYGRIRTRRGPGRACIAIANTIIVIIYHLLTRQEPYRDLGPDYFEKRNRVNVVRRALNQLKKAGIDATVLEHRIISEIA